MPESEADERAPAVVDTEETDASAEASVESELRAEFEELQDRHLRLAAEFDNFKKRTARERVEGRARAQGEIVSLMLDALDDLGRVAHVDPAATNAKDVVDGVELVERKLYRLLEAAGLERIGAVGEGFDPNQHEAIGTVPATHGEGDHTVAAVLQPGYRFSGQLLRPARVQVFVAAPAAETGEAED